MNNPANIFISSAYETDLIDVRIGLKDELIKAGHNAVIFEETGRPWGRDTISDCIDMVKQSDIVILLIKDKAGSDIQDGKTTPTYIEFYNALREGKYILAFVDKYVKDLYDRYMHQLLDEFYNNHLKENNNIEPDYMIDIVNQVFETLPPSFREELKDVDPFVWGFIYEVRKNTPWLYKLSIAKSNDFYNEVKRYLSSNLAIGIKYVPIEEDIRLQAMEADEFYQFKRYTKKLLSCLHNGKIKDWKKFLKFALEPLCGGSIIRREGTYTEEIIGSFNPCSAITVYVQKDNFMNLVGHYGDVTPEDHDLYEISDKDSYVATTYREGTEEVYYREDKQMLYFTIKSNEFVICYHFPLNESWESGRVIGLQKEIKSAIIKQTLYFEFISQLIGGIRYE